MLEEVILQEHATTPPALAYFDAGSEAFERSDFPTALLYFRQAAAAGYKDVDLTYNLAVTYAQLGQYQKAYRYFSLVEQQNSDYLERAAYNKALMLELQGKKDEAIVAFEQLALRLQDPDLVELAELKLQQLQLQQVSLKAGKVAGKGARKAGSPVFAGMELSLFQDNYVNLVDGEGFSFIGDSLARQLVFFTQWPGTSSGGVTVLASDYDAEGYDRLFVTGNYGYDVKFSNRSVLELSVAPALFQLESAPYLDYLTGRANWSYQVSTDQYIGLRGTLQRVWSRADNTRPYAGQQVGMTLVWGYEGRVDLDLMFTLSQFDRGSLQYSLVDGGTSYDLAEYYDLQKQQIQASVSYSLQSDFALRLEASYYQHDYDTPNRLLSFDEQGDLAIIDVLRKDRIRNLDVILTYSGIPSWDMSLRYSTSELSSSIPDYSYDQTELGISAQYRFNL
ncbi:MAG: tetratricopeptide repeat protein [Gammaproteobacteria bacterium]